jgi:hypothetical protein
MLVTLIEQHGDAIITAQSIDELYDRFGLVTVLCRSPISLCHLGFEREGADAAQI